MIIPRYFSLLALIFWGLGLGQNYSAAHTAQEFLESTEAPNFKIDHKLLPLTRWGWTVSYETSLELTQRWGYALEFGGYATKNVSERASDINTREGKICALARSAPEQYPMFVLADRPLLALEKSGKVPESYWLHDKHGKRLNGATWKLKNPEAPIEIFEKMAAETMAPLDQIASHCPIAIVLDGGETGLAELGHTGIYLRQDFAVVEAKAGEPWWDYYSRRKREWLQPTSTAIKKSLPGRTAYVWYHFGGMPRWQPEKWAWKYEYLREIADYPGQSLYYQHFNSGWTGDKDLLTHFLASYAQAAEFGDHLSYNWVNGGWKDGRFSSTERYMGFLKSLYMAGQIGAVAGYFSYPDAGFSGDLGDELPNWLSQMMILSRVHALFSHLEDFLYGGVLLTGSDENIWARKQLGKSLPSYELDSGEENVRVLARKSKTREEWLVSAWATAGSDRPVVVFLDELGEVDLMARSSGSIYRISILTQQAHEPPSLDVKLLDVDGMRPTKGLR